MATSREDLIERIRSLAEENEADYPDVAGVLYTLGGAMKLKVEDVLHTQCARFAQVSMEWMEKQKAKRN
jgi:hypothetical protein